MRLQGRTPWTCSLPVMAAVLQMQTHDRPSAHAHPASVLLRERRRVLYAAGCTAGGLLLPGPATPNWADSGGRFPAGPDGVQNIAPLSWEALLSSDVPFSLNELDSATIEALLQEENFLRKEENIANDVIFTFRGQQLVKTNPDGAVSYMSRRNAVLFGETHDSARDKRLATRILRQLERKRGKVALGLEMVQQPFQPVLDWYVFQATPSKAADKTLFRETEWDYRWGWDFEAYLPILKYAQLHKVPMIALNVEAELTSRVRKLGLPALSSAERDRLIMDPAGFRDDALAPGFIEYCDAVLRPSFDAHLAMGMFQNTDNAFSNFVSNRILWDETMASVASRFLLRHPDYLLCGLVGGDHVKTGHGIPARIERILTNAQQNKGLEGQIDNARVTSVALNPSWKLYSASRKLVEVDRRERLADDQQGAPSKTARDRLVQSNGDASRGDGRGGIDVQAGGEERGSKGGAGSGWKEPPPRGQHPFSDIIWFS